MTEDNDEARVPLSDSSTTNDASRTRQRRKRKWDQPAEQLVAAGVAFPQLLPLGNTMNVPSMSPLLQTLLVPLAVPKVNQPKIQDEVIIAREIVINDAEASLRHRLTKRSTQEDIQRSTGAVVITRGKYRPPNAPPDGEKPLYLHISAAAQLQLKETTERILAVDRAAAMIEEMMKQKSISQIGSVGLQTVKMLSTCVYLGFEADPSSNVAARIRGPNDQYINHIMNETGATVVLRGRGSGSLENQHGDEAQLPLHLLLSGSNPKSIDDAKRLAENLMDTISVEFGASRVSSSKVYGAVPPPQQLISGAPGSDQENQNLISTYGLMTSIPITAPPYAVSSFPVTPATSLYPQFPVMQSLGISNGGPSQPVAGGTSYSGYAGIYPQATPLQQVAQVLKQSISPVISTVPPTMLTATSLSIPSDNASNEMERRPPRKRKFQELPADCKVPEKDKQQSELAMTGDVTPSANRVRSPPSPRSVMPPPPPKTIAPPPSKTMSPPSSKSMLPPPPRSKTMSPLTSKSMLPPPPRFTLTTQPSRLQDNHISVKKPNPVPDTLIKLMEYGDDEDDDDDPDEPLTTRS